MKTRQRLALSKPPNPSADRKPAVEVSTQRQDVTATSACTLVASPVRHFHMAKQDEDILWSPHLKMQLGKEDLCSQTVNSQEILWDYTSPDAIRQLKRNRKCRNGNNLSDVVLRLLDDVHSGEVSTTTPPLLSLWMESKLTDDKNKPLPEPTVTHHRKSTRRRRRPTGHEEDETKALLKRMIQRCEVIEEASSEDGNDDNDQLKESMKKLNNCEKESPKSSKCTSLCNNSGITEQLKTGSPDKSELDIWTDDDLFDDDLFDDNSFILEATELPAGKRKINSPAREQPSVKNKRYTFSLTADCNIIPPTFVTSNSTKPETNTCQNSYKNCDHHSIAQNYKSYSSRQGWATNNNSLKKYNSFDDKCGFIGSHGPGHSYVMSKSPWRRSNSFSGSQSPANLQQKQPSCNISRSETERQPSHTISRSETDHKDKNIEINNNLSNAIVGRKFVMDSCKPKVATTCDNRFQAFVRNELKSASVCNKNDSLDTSITDELLYQLAEPDELLESQLTPEGAAHKICTELDKDDLFDDDMDFVSSVNTNVTNTKSVSTMKDGEKRLCLKYNGQLPSCDKILQNGSSRMLAHVAVSECVPPTQKTTQGKFTFKNVELNSEHCNITNSDHVPGFVSENKSNSSAVSVMKKAPQIETGTGSKCAGFERGSNQDIDADDSFLSDDALFESQILAMLDEVESQATQKTPLISSVSSNKCTSKEIERKRLAALEKKKKNHPL